MVIPLKKIIAFCLTFAMLFALCACGSGGESATSANSAAGFRVGYGRVDITPYEESVPLAGYGNTSTRMSDGCADRLYITCVAFSDTQDETVLMYTVDLASISAVAEDLREAISEGTGISVDRIFVAATHTHSAPDLGNTNELSITRYRTRLEEWAVMAGNTALSDRAPATMEIASSVAENLNFVRHYYVSDGGVVGENFGVLGSRTYVSHCHDADGQIQVIRLAREEKEDVVLVNWQVHPTRYGNTTNASADFISPLRARLEEKLDCKVAYFSGASGNLNPGSRITSEMRTQDYKQMGQLLADYAIEALKTPTAVATGNVRLALKTVTAPVDKSEEHKLAEALVIRDLWASTNNLNLCMEEAAKVGLGSQWHAAGIITRNTRLGDTISMEIGAFSIGDVAFVSAPYEMFDQNGVQIKEGSPFKMTFISTLCNGGNGYIASRECATHGCYGYDSRSFGSVGAAEELVTDYLGLLDSLHTSN